MRLARSRLFPLLLAALAPVARAQRPAEPALTAEQWRADLRVMAAEMEHRHKSLYHAVSRERFAAEVAALDARIPAMRRNEVIVGFMRLAALVGDGHTNVSPFKDPRVRFPSLPLKLYLFDDGLFVRAAAPAWASLVGARVEAIGGVTMAEALRRVAEVSPRDNDVTPAFYASILLGMPDVLQPLGLSATRDSAKLTLRKDGRAFTVTVPAGAVDAPWPGDTDISFVTPDGWVDARASAAVPEWLREPLAFHRIVEMPAERVLYARLTMVADVEGETLGQFGARIRARARATRPRAIVLDVRLNRGGNMDLRFGLVRELIKAEDDDTRLFVLVGRGSFSATQAILDDLSRFSEAVLVGEPASSKPNAFGDSYRIVLPNSGLTVRTSIKWHQVDDGDDPYTFVDVAAPPTFASYVAGRDPALEAALAYVPRPSLERRLLAAAAAGGVDAVREALAAFETDRANRFANLRRQLVLAPQSLAQAGRKEEALWVARAATERFPASSAAWSVLAHVGEWTGHLDVAREAGARAIALEPDNREVRSLLERVRAKGP